MAYTPSSALPSLPHFHEHFSSSSPMHPSTSSPKRRLEASYSPEHEGDDPLSRSGYFFNQQQKMAYDHPYPYQNQWMGHHYQVPRQRQESGSSVSSTSSWGSVASSYSNSSTSECPSLMAYSPKLSSPSSFSTLSSPPTRSTTPQPIKRTRSESSSSTLSSHQRRFGPYAREMESSTRSSPPMKAHSSSLSDLVFAIALDASLTCALKEATNNSSATKNEVQVIAPQRPVAKSRSRTQSAEMPLRRSSSSHSKTDPQGLRIVFSTPDWLNQHMKMAKRVALQRSCSVTPMAF